jgi:hypothetical protein
MVLLLSSSVVLREIQAASCVPFLNNYKGSAGMRKEQILKNTGA